MRVFVAGGTGVIGRRLVPQLVALGHQVTATTTSAGSCLLQRSRWSEIEEARRPRSPSPWTDAECASRQAAVFGRSSYTSVQRGTHARHTHHGQPSSG